MRRLTFDDISLLFIALQVGHVHSFSTISGQDFGKHVRSADRTSLRLHRLITELPLREHMPAASKQWDFHLLETSDLKEASELALECFYSPRITLSLEGMTGVEKWLWGGITNLYSTVDKSDTRNGNYLGMKSRSGNRLSAPSFKLTSDSFILAATPAGQEYSKVPAEIAAIVEICIEMPGGKLAPPIANPFRPKTVKEEDQPYLCNLCVGKAYRRRGLGRLICELSEELVQIHWKRKEMYLHVEQSNIAAQKLYLGMGYELVTPGLSAWEKKMEGIENILYYSNDLVRKWDGSRTVEGEQLLKDVGAKSYGVEQDADSVLLGMNTLDMAVASNIMRSKS